MDKSLLSDATSADDSPVSGYMLKEIARKASVCLFSFSALDFNCLGLFLRGNYFELPCVLPADRLLRDSYQKE